MQSSPHHTGGVDAFRAGLRRRVAGHWHGHHPQGEQTAAAVRVLAEIVEVDAHLSGNANSLQAGHSTGTACHCAAATRPSTARQQSTVQRSTALQVTNAHRCRQNRRPLINPQRPDHILLMTDNVPSGKLSGTRL